MTSPGRPDGETRSGAASRSVVETVTVLAGLVDPASVIDVGSEDGTWLDAFRALGVDDVLLVRPVLHPALATAEGPTLAHDLHLSLRLERRFDLAVAVATGEHLPAGLATVLVRSLCDAADVVAFASALPGLAPPGTVNARWPAWWDSLFEERGYVPHDVARPLLWEEEAVELTVRQGLVLYAPHGRLAAAGLPPGVQRSVVHPEAYHAALAYAESRRQSELAMAGQRSLAGEAESSRLVEENRRLVGELAATKAALSEACHPKELADARTAAEEAGRDAVLLRAAVAAAQREGGVAPTPQHLLAAARRGPVPCLGRALTAALPMRHGLRHLVGPSAPLWDEEWYVSRSPEALCGGLSPLWHYRRHGARALRSPHPWFDPEWYATRNPAVVAAGHDPAEHYVRVGWREGRDPHPLFSTTWYGREHASGDRWRRSPLEHYLERGRRAGLPPHPLFDTDWYLLTNPGVCEPDDDPVQHFLRRGWIEARNPHPLFDVGWYLLSNPDVAREGVNPLVHYLWFGWREGRDPHPLFDTSRYLEANPELRDAGQEPLAHYLTVGAGQGLSTGPFDTAWYVEQHPEAAADGRNPLVYFVQTGRPRDDRGSAS